MSFGFWAYVAGLIISVALGFSGLDLIFSLIILSMLGLIVGFLNLDGDSEHLFSLFALTLSFWILHYFSSTAFGTLAADTGVLSDIFLSLSLFSIFVILVMAFKNLYSSSSPSSGSNSRYNSGGSNSKQDLRVRRVA